jgi:single-strand DNA-binding protein
MMKLFRVHHVHANGLETLALTVSAGGLKSAVKRVREHPLIRLPMGLTTSLKQAITVMACKSHSHDQEEDNLMLNRITMTGRLVADPELRRTQSGVSVTSFRIANDRDYGKGEEKETDFFDVVAWRSTAEFICKYFTKGRMISVDGRLQTRGWKDREGNNRVSIEILVDNAYFADSKKDDAAGDFPADDQFAGYGAYQGSVPGGGDDFAPDF